MANPFKAKAADQRQRNVASAAESIDRFDLASQILSAPASQLDPDQIQPRKSSTRQLDQEHVDALLKSIAVLGLIEPVVIDRKNRLLAGEHRLAAVTKLRAEQPGQYEHWFGGGVPVRILDLDADEDERRALEIEVAENEHRRDYTHAEIQALAERLKAAGYRDLVGRPRRGEKPLGPALQIIIGKSARTIRKILTGPTESEPQPTLHPLTGLQRSLLKHKDVMPEHLRASYERFVEEVRQEIDGA